MGTKKAFKTNVGGSRVVNKDGNEVKEPSNKKVSKKTGTKQKGKDNVS
jgi:hypothetical protein